MDQYSQYSQDIGHFKVSGKRKAVAITWRLACPLREHARELKSGILFHATKEEQSQRLVHLF